MSSTPKGWASWKALTSKQAATASSAPVVTTSSSNFAWYQSVQTLQPEAVQNECVYFDREDFEKLTQSMHFLLMPPNIDLKNPVAIEAVAEWYNAINQLKHTHQQLQLIANLTQDHD